MALKHLTELSRGEMARVLRLEGDEDVCRRLRSIGISEDSRVRRAFESPFGDPVAYEVQGILVAIRKEDGSKILVEEEPSWD